MTPSVLHASPQVRLVNLEHRNDGAFTFHLETSLGTIADCYARQVRTGWLVHGPGRRVRDRWMQIVRFTGDVEREIVRQLEGVAAGGEGGVA